MPTNTSNPLIKVPEVTLLFWVMKIMATTLGETGGDTVTMSMGLGYLSGCAIFAVFFLLCLKLQLSSQRFNAWLYWLTIVATTTIGTTLADFVDRSLGIGYLGGTLILIGLLAASLLSWHVTLGSISFRSLTSRPAEIFYWVTILFSQTLGTALGDWTADSAHIGYLGGSLLFWALLALLAVLYYRTQLSRTLLFWAAFIVTRPLGATLGDFLDKPLQHGGLDLSRYSADAVLIAVLLVCLCLFPQRPAATHH